MKARGLALGIALALGAPTAVAGILTRAPAAAAGNLVPTVTPAPPLGAIQPTSIPLVASGPVPRPVLPVRVYHPLRPAIVLRPGVAPTIIRSLRVHEPVVFLTIDDGYFPDARVAALVRAGIPMTAFLVADAVNRYPAYYRWLARDGAHIEDHTQDHPFLPDMSQAAQTHEICRPIGQYQRMFGVRPHLFRPPYGGYNMDTMRAVRACGLGDVFLWDAEVRFGHLSTLSHGLRAGDIILLHWRPELYDELGALFKYLCARHLGVGSLEDYVVPFGTART